MALKRLTILLVILIFCGCSSLDFGPATDITLKGAARLLGLKVVKNNPELKERIIDHCNFILEHNDIQSAFQMGITALIAQHTSDLESEEEMLILLSIQDVIQMMRIDVDTGQLNIEQIKMVVRAFKGGVEAHGPDA
jgi:hypothetical protein